MISVSFKTKKTVGSQSEPSITSPKTLAQGTRLVKTPFLIWARPSGSTLCQYIGGPSTPDLICLDTYYVHRCRICDFFIYLVLLSKRVSMTILHSADLNVEWASYKNNCGIPKFFGIPKISACFLLKICNENILKKIFFSKMSHFF